MPLEIKLDAVPHLKGLINGENISGRQECGSTFIKPKTHLKSTHFTSYRANRTDTFLSQCMNGLINGSNKYGRQKLM